MVEKIQANFIQTAVTAPSVEKKPDVKDNKESSDFVKKHAVEIGLGAAAVAAAVIGGIYYVKHGKGEDAAEAVVKQGEELLSGASRKGTKTSEPAVKVPETKEPVKPAKPGEEPKPVKKETAPEEIKPSNPAFSPAVIKEAQELFDSAPKNLKEVLEETQRQVDNYDFVKNPLSTDFTSYKGRISSTSIFKDITDENDKTIMKVWSVDGKKVSSIDIYNPETSKKTFVLSYNDNDRLNWIKDVNNKKEIFLNDGKINFTDMSEGEIGKSNYIRYSSDAQFSKYKYDNEKGHDIRQVSYFLGDDCKTLKFVIKFDDAGKELKTFYFNPDGSLKSVI